MLSNIKKWLRFKVLFPGLAFLPRSFAYRLADQIGSRDARRHVTKPAVVSGLKTLFPELQENQNRCEEFVVKHFKMLARDTLDSFLMPRFSAANTRSLIQVKNVEVLSEAKSAGKGVIMIISHYGRFFMLGPGLKFAGEEFGMLTTMVDERHPSYDAVDRWYMAKKLHNTQIFSRGTWITTADDSRKIYRCLKKGEIILFALDGNETTSKVRVSFPFFNGALSLPEGMVRIASATGARLVYAATQDTEEGVSISLYPLSDNPRAALSEAIKLLEKDMRRTPWHWWLWPGLTSLWQAGDNKSDRDDQCT